MACIYLVLPDSNGHQERVFSACTRMDGILKQSQNPATFEMKVLHCKNKEVMEELRGLLDESTRSIARLATTDLLDLSRVMKGLSVDEEEQTEDTRDEAHEDDRMQQLLESEIEKEDVEVLSLTNNSTLDTNSNKDSMTEAATGEVEAGNQQEV